MGRRQIPNSRSLPAVFLAGPITGYMWPLSISPRRRLYPPAWKPYGLEAEPKARDLHRLIFEKQIGEGSNLLLTVIL